MSTSHLIAFGVGQVDVAHGDGDVAVDLDAVLSGVIVVADLHPVLQSKSGVVGKIGVAADEVSQRTGLRRPEGVLAVGQRGLEEDLACVVVVQIGDGLVGDGLVVTPFGVDLANLHQRIAPRLLGCVYFLLGDFCIRILVLGSRPAAM